MEQSKQHATKLVKGKIAPRVREKSMGKELKEVNPNTLLELLKFHPRIKEASERLFKNSHYAQAILEAFKTVNNFVKEKSGKQEWDGKNLMAKVFRKENPIIRFNKLKTISDKDEQEGFMFLFMGAMVGIRNPKAHDNIIQTDPYKTLEYLSFASLLAKKVEESELVDLLTDRQKKIIEYINKEGKITTSETKKVLRVLDQAAVKELQRLVKLKIIQSKGEGRGIHYVSNR